MKSTEWPINWSYDGDIDKAKSFHGEGRAVLGQLKNQTYGGANLGSNRVHKEYNDGVEITAEILPGIDKVHIFVPIIEEGGKKPPDDYQPYLWVGARIVSGGIYQGEYSDFYAGIANFHDHRIMMHVWEPPQDSKQGQGWTHLDPNETQVITTFRHDENAIGFGCYTSDCYPMQFDRYWQEDSIKNHFIVYGKSIGQYFVTRCTSVPYGKEAYYSGPTYFTGDVLLQHTDDGLMNADWLQPYDPEFDFDDPDDDNVWFVTTWCDPTISKWDFSNGTPPRKHAEGTIPAGPASGYIAPKHDSYANTSSKNGYFELYDPPEIKARVIPGKYAVKINVLAGQHCPPHSGPLVIEVEARVGKPQGTGADPKGGRTAKLRHTISIYVDSTVANYAHNIVPYGWYRENHQSTGETDYLGGEIPEGWGACPQSPGSWWLGAILIDGYSGSIEVVDYFNLDEPGYEIRNTNVAGTWTDRPFGQSPTWSHECAELPCTGVPCSHSDKSVWGALGRAGHTKDSLKAGSGAPWVTYEIFGSSGPFTYADFVLEYLVGKEGYIECTWSGADIFPLIGADILLDDFFRHHFVICDDTYSDYNGEFHTAYTLGQFSPSGVEWPFYGPVHLGQKCIVVLAYLTDLWIAPVDNAPHYLLLRKASSEFEDDAGGPPPGY